MTTYTFSMHRPKFEEFPEVRVDFTFKDNDGLTVDEMLQQFHAFLGGCGYILNGEFYYDHKQS